MRRNKRICLCLVLILQSLACNAETVFPMNSTKMSSHNEVDTIDYSVHPPIDLTLLDFLYYPLGFIKPEYYNVTIGQLTEYLSVFQPQLSMTFEEDGANTILEICGLKTDRREIITIRVFFNNDGYIIKYLVSSKPPFFWYDSLCQELERRGYKDVSYERKEYWHYVVGYRSNHFRTSLKYPLTSSYTANDKVFYPEKIECYFYNCYNSMCMIVSY